MFKYLVCMLGLLTHGDASLFSSAPEWDGLRTTWGLNLFNSVHFRSQPRTESSAISDGFIMISGCNGNITKANAKFAGKRYVKNNDYSLVLMYDRNGYISGMQIAVPQYLENGYPHAPLINHPFVADRNKWFLTAYFTDPTTICTTGRSANQFSREGTGNNLYIQNGSNPITDSIIIPKSQTDLQQTQWTLGKCFYAMGDHYWYNISRDMSCDDFYPVFLLYNDGKLNAFGWALNANLTSDRIEHPHTSALSNFFKPADLPTCLSQQETLSTLHIYLTSTPLLNVC